MSRDRRIRSGAALTVVMGIVIPAALLHFDPFLFGGQDGDSLVGSLSAGVYVLMFLGMTALVVQLAIGRRAPLLSWILSGGIFAGSLIAGVSGAVMLPMSVLGIRVYGLGILGFYPFVVGTLYFRMARSALLAESRPVLRQSPARPAPWRPFCAVAGFVMAFTIPALLLFAANRELDRLAAAARAGDDINRVNWRTERLLTWAGDSDRIVHRYQKDRPGREQRDLDVLYHGLTGRDIQARLEQLKHPD